MPAADEEWQLPNGTARVHYGQGQPGVVRPVVLADGFDLGPSDLDGLYDWLENGRYPFISQLRARGRTTILVGFDERSESILRNAETMMAAIMRTSAEQLGDTRLMVGGFSRGGVGNGVRAGLGVQRQMEGASLATVRYSERMVHRSQ
ncbi:hypothetical protein [Streptomyces griseoluteus]|uniref:hypothetical protein n=1 Tax=Streptomyces griseoluteus TaxID=29306 RepID=UPI00367BA6F3